MALVCCGGNVLQWGRRGPSTCFKYEKRGGGATQKEIVRIPRPPPPPSHKTDTLRQVRVIQEINSSHKVTAQSPKDAGPLDQWTKDRLFKELRIADFDIPKGNKERLKDVLWDHRDVFSKHEFDLGECNFYTAKIRLKSDAEPQYVSPIPTPYKRRETLQRHLDGMLKSGVIKDVTGNYQLWNARVFLIFKPHQPGKFRFVADFRSLNSKKKYKKKLPNINTVTEKWQEPIGSPP